MCSQLNVLAEHCPSRTSLARIANKWTALVIIALAGGAMRFSGLRTAVEGVSAKVLTQTLRDLERDGLVRRTQYRETPPRVEYELTPLGGTLLRPLRALEEWAREHLPEVEEARARYDGRAPGAG